MRLESLPQSPYGNLMAEKTTTDRAAIVTGAGSGVGRAVALRLAEDGWAVALVGRRAAALEETRSLAGPFADQLFVHPCNVADPKAADEMVANALEEMGG